MADRLRHYKFEDGYYCDDRKSKKHECWRAFRHLKGPHECECGATAPSSSKK